MIDPAGTLLGDEAKVEKFYFDEYRELFFDIPMTIYDFLGRLASEADSVEAKPSTSDELACRTIFVRILQDLRCVQLCASREYAPAAASITASIIELSYEIAYLAGNSDRSDKWFEHRDMRRTSEEHNNRVGSVLKSQTPEYSERKPIEDIEWENYRIVSAIKHGNSIFQQMFGFQMEEESIIYSAIPETLKQVNETSSLMIYRACQYAIRAGIWFSNAYLSNTIREQHGEELKSLTENLRLAADKSIPKTA